jgi:transcriptional regulator GlxA family with amidase domain
VRLTVTSKSEARRVDIVMFNGVDELDVVAPFEILASTGFDVALVTLQPCSSVIGAMLIAASGLLRGRPAVTHRSALDDLRNYGARVHADARVVDDGDVLTSGGVTSGIDLALRLIEREYGREAALREGTRIEHEYRGPVLSKA